MCKTNIFSLIILCGFTAAHLGPPPRDVTLGEDPAAILQQTANIAHPHKPCLICDWCVRPPNVDTIKTLAFRNITSSLLSILKGMPRDKRLPHIHYVWNAIKIINPQLLNKQL